MWFCQHLLIRIWVGELHCIGHWYLAKRKWEAKWIMWLRAKLAFSMTQIYLKCGNKWNISLLLFLENDKIPLSISWARNWNKANHLWFQRRILMLYGITTVGKKMQTWHMYWVFGLIKCLSSTSNCWSELLLYLQKQKNLSQWYYPFEPGNVK